MACQTRLRHAARLGGGTWQSRPGSLEHPRLFSLSSRCRSEPKKTPLYDLHVENGAKLVEFGGYTMPVLYSGKSIVDSCKWTRTKASLFDVSHMTQHKFGGRLVAQFLETVTPSAINSLQPFRSTYSAFLNDQAGIVDDTIITNITEQSPTFHIVTNAGNHQVDLDYFDSEIKSYKSKHGEDSITWEVIHHAGLVALQGPMAATILQSLNPHFNKAPFDLNSLTFGNAKWLLLHDPRDASSTWTSLVARTGYTGEDGFELSIPHTESSINPSLSLARTLLDVGGSESIALAGLGARDVLRLEAGLCLHGHDINATTTPIQAGLAWIIPKARRTEEAGFKGAQKLYGAASTKVAATRRVGMMLQGRGPAAREGDAVFVDSQGTQAIGSITSGSPSPHVEADIAMGYLAKDFSKVGQACYIKVRGKMRAAQVLKLPFIPTKYFGLAKK